MANTVLFVDDEPDILRALERLFLENDDVEVRTAGNAEAALAILAGDNVDLVVSDKVMPGIDGVELLQRVRTLYPDLPLMMLTGYESDASDAISALDGEIDVIPKPWDGDTLRSTVGEILVTRASQQERKILLECGFVTEKQIKRAERVRSHMDEQPTLGQVLVELGSLEAEQYEEIQRERRTGMSLVALLREDGYLTEEGFADYLVAREADGEATDRELLVDSELVNEEQYLRAVSAKFDIPYIEPDVAMLDDAMIGKTSLRYLQRHLALPLKSDGDELRMVVADPLNRPHLSELERTFDRKIAPCCCPSGKIIETISTLERLRAGQSGDDNLSLQYRVIEEPGTADGSSGEEAVQIVDYLLLRAIQLGASDLHIEPMQTRVRARVRVDGVLQHLTDLPSAFGRRLAARIKVIAGADISERRKHQDGKIFVKVEGSEVDIRVSSYVSMFGETLVLRLLSRSGNLMTLDRIGFSPRAHSVLEDIVLRASSGLVLMTGPTGSGKTTTLYSFVEKSLDPSEKIITCEDPVEYVLDGVTQCSVNSKGGTTFAASLRSMLRQDPDTIIVGEMRDAETANLALEAALTGHKVYSTFHTEDAVSVIVRLLDMGVEPFLVSSTVTAIVAQRLVRSLCDKCKAPAQPARAELRFLGIERGDLKGLELFAPESCGACQGTGYRGRMGIYEVLLPDDDFRDAVLQRCSAKDLRELARKLPEFTTLQEDALVKAADGKTSLDEIVDNVPRDVKARDLATLRRIGGYGRTE